MAEQAQTLMTVDEFLAWDDGTDTRYELVDGTVRAMAPPAGAHGTIVAPGTHSGLPSGSPGRDSWAWVPLALSAVI